MAGGELGLSSAVDSWEFKVRPSGKPRVKDHGRESRVDSSEFKVKSPKFKMESAARLWASVTGQDSVTLIVSQVVKYPKAIEKSRKTREVVIPRRGRRAAAWRSYSFYEKGESGPLAIDAME